jgi:hypothetical protein
MNGKFIHEDTVTREWMGEEDGYDIIETDDGFNVYQRSMHLGCFGSLEEATNYANQQCDEDEQRRDDARKTAEGAAINKARAERAVKAMKGGGYEATADLIADLLHYCDEEELDFDLMVEDARRNYQNERGPGDDIEQDARRLFAETGQLG